MKYGKKILSLLLSVIMVLGVCAAAPFTVSADITCQVIFDLPQDPGTVHYFTVICDYVTKYLKVVKTGYTSNEANNLTVYEAESLTDAISASYSSENFTGTWDDPGQMETWTIAVSDSYGYSELSDINQIPQASISYDGLADELPEGTVRYFSLEATPYGEDPVTYYLKAVKSSDSDLLTVHEGASLKEIAYELSASGNFLIAWNYYNGIETWTVFADAEYSGVSDFHELDWISKTFGSEQAEGATKYFALECFDGIACFKKYLKVIKREAGNLPVYEADSFKGAAESDIISANLFCEWSVTGDTETWTIYTEEESDYIAIAGLEDAVETVEISDYAGLLAFANRVNSGETNLSAVLTADIDASASATANDWTPIGNIDNKYTGTFDGMDSDGIMHTITGLTFNDSDADYAGLFGYVGEGGRVQNVGLEGGKITGGQNVGGVIGLNDGGATTNCYNTGNVTVTAVTTDEAGTTTIYAGGVVGENIGGSVENCSNAGSVTVQGKDSVVGGVVGKNFGTVTICYNIGDVKNDSNDSMAMTGGVAGANNSTVTNCYNAGGVTVEAYSTIVETGGVVGSNGGTVTNCYNTGDLTVEGDSAVVETGGVVGGSSYTVTNCCYDKNVCGDIGAVDGEDTETAKGLTTAEMTGASALDNMVFDTTDENPWLVKENDSAASYYPHLKGFNLDEEGQQLPAESIEAENWPPKTEAPVTTYPLWVGGEQVTSANMGDLSVIEGVSVAEDGWAKFEVKDGKNILYLKNAAITGTQTYDYAGEYTSNILVENTEFDLTINLEGENTLSDAQKGIWMPDASYASDLTVTGGKLSVTASFYCIDVYDYLLIDDADISATAAGDENDYGDGISAFDVEIKNSSVYAEGAEDGIGICCYGALSITGSSVEAKSTGMNSFGGIYIDNNCDLTISGDSVVIAEGGPKYGAFWTKGEYIFNDGNEIIEPANSRIKPNESFSYLNAVYAVNDDETEAIAQKVVIAQPQTISVTANPSNGGTVTGGGKTYKGAEVTVKATPATGYSFVNWTDANGVVSTSTEYTFTVEGSRNLSANFTPDPHTVSVSANPTEGGTVSGEGTYDYGSSAILTATPKDHYHFVNWTENGEEVSTDAAYTFTVDKDRNLVANFAKDTFTITFENDDGTPLQSGSVAYGETPAYTGETPTKGSTDECTFTFAGWSPDIKAVDGDATYTATYTSTPVDYKLTWVIDGENYKNETIPFGSNVTAPEVDEKAGYTFAWIDEIPSTMPAENVTINGEFTAIKYTATFTADGETVDTVKFTVETEKLDEPAVPAKEGYEGKWSEYEIAAGDMEITAEYTPVEYTATFVADGVTVAEIKFTVETESIEAPEVPEKEGFTGEWSEYTLTASDITIEAVYTEVIPENLCPLDNEDHGDGFIGRVLTFIHTLIWKTFRLFGLNVFFKMS